MAVRPAGQSGRFIRHNGRIPAPLEPAQPTRSVPFFLAAGLIWIRQSFVEESPS